MKILKLRVAKSGVMVLCNGKSCFSMDPTQEVTLVISQPQEANYKLHHCRMEENANRDSVNRYRTKYSS